MKQKENDTKRAGGRAYDCIHVVTDSVCLRWRDGTACDVCNLLGAGAADCGYRSCVNYERGVQFPLYRNRGGRSVRLNFHFEGTVNSVLNEGMISVLTSSDNVGIIIFLVVLGVIVSMMNKAGDPLLSGSGPEKGSVQESGHSLRRLPLGF